MLQNRQCVIENAQSCKKVLKSRNGLKGISSFSNNLGLTSLCKPDHDDVCQWQVSETSLTPKKRPMVRATNIVRFVLVILHVLQQ
jgi:hypothetical protein